MESRGKGRKRPRSPGSAGSKLLKKSSDQTLSEDLLTTKSEKDEKATGTSNTEKNGTAGPDFLCFKNPKYRENGFALKTKVWKNLKQIMALQKSQSSAEVAYASIDAPPSTFPVKKYSDLSGLPALYTDPNTKLRYANSDEYQQIQHLSSDAVIGLLALRRANY